MSGTRLYCLVTEEQARNFKQNFTESFAAQEKFYQLIYYYTFQTLKQDKLEE